MRGTCAVGEDGNSRLDVEVRGRRLARLRRAGRIETSVVLLRDENGKAGAEVAIFFCDFIHRFLKGRLLVRRHLEHLVVADADAVDDDVRWPLLGFRALLVLFDNLDNV